jgi:hypothetical protein
MALSACARDILKLLGEGSSVYIDAETEIVIDVTRIHTVKGNALTSAIDMLAAQGRKRMHCSVDFEKAQVTFKPGTCIVDTPLQLDVGKDPDTESDKAAVAIARSMGVIDLDNLLPECCIESSNGVTRVYFSRLLHVSHDAVVHYMRAHAGLDVAYDMDEHMVCVSLPRTQKRKR